MIHGSVTAVLLLNMGRHNKSSNGTLKLTNSFIMATLIYMINPGYIMDLVNDPRGQIMIGLGFASFFVGAFVMYRMCKFEV